MKILGIIAEYNPFHMGHRYQIKRAKEVSGADYVIAIMSGNYVQRGAPAVFEKSVRTRTALNAGIDAVFEIPSFFSGASAPDFAQFGISLLDILGVDYISFGAENDNHKLLDTVSDILLEKQTELSIKKYIKSGLNYAKARHSAIMDGGFGDVIQDGQKVFQIKEILSSPNNILAVEYLKNIKLINSNIKPIIIGRSGSGYHKKDVEKDKFASATAIRNELFKARESSNYNIFCNDKFVNLIPKENIDILNSTGAVFEDDFLFTVQRNFLDKIYTGEELNSYCDVSNELANTIKQNINEIKSKSFEDFILSLKSKNFTYTRISRAIFHILLNHKKKELKEIKMESDIAAYPVLLGFKKSAAGLLSELKLRSRKPVISKMSSAKKLLSEISLKIFENNIYCDFLYNSIYFEKYGENPYNPYRRRIVIL